METLQNIFQAEIIQKLGWTLVHFVWQATAIGLILAIVLKLLHKSSANLRYIIACIALALIVVMPAVTIKMIDVSSNIIEPIKQTTVESPKADTDTQTVLEIPAIEPTIKIAASSRIPLKDKFIEIIEPALPYSVASWFVGVFGLSLWHLGGWRQLQKLRKKMTKNVPYEIAATAKKLSRALGIKKAVSIAESALVEVPTVIGHLKPIILLPASALTGLSVQQIEAILAHELAHIKRHDYLVNILQTVVEILGFYHPAVWWVSHKIRAERENCCDDIAVNLCSDKICYARALTTMEEIRTGKLSLAVAASGGNLLMRIRRLLGKESASEGKLSWLPSVITILLIVALLIPTALALNSKPKPVLANVGTNNLIHLISVTPEEITIERLASICECMESSIIDIAVDYEWYRDPPVKPGNIAGTGILTTIGTEKHHWSTARPFSDFSLTSMSANFTNGSGNTFRSTTKQSYDGKIGKYLQVIKRPNKSFSTADSIITKSRRFMKTKSLSPETFSIFHFRKEGPISKILKMGYPLEIELNKDVDIINGFNTIHTVVSKKIEDGRKILIYRIYFAVEQGYTPVRFEHSNGREIVYRVDVTKLKKVSKGLWYPAGGRLGAIKENYSNFYKANKIIINQGIGANYFDLEFPQGTKVIDEINNTEFIVRPTKKQKEKFDKEQEYIKKHADEIKAEREDGGRIYSAAMLYKLGITKYIYFTDNNKNLPKRLGDLKSYLNDETFSWLSKNIIYLGVKEKLSEIDPAKTPLAYDKTLLMQENSQGTNILYSDSRVVFAKTEALKELGIKAEHFAKMQSKLEILNIELEPIAQGKNILYANVKNTSDTEQLFAIHIYTRSVDYGSQGIGWGTRFFEKIKPNEIKRVRFAYKIQGPVTENTYVRVKFYNPATEKDYNYDKPFNVRLYESSDLPKPGKLIESPKKVTDQQMVDEIFNIFHSIQANIKNGDYESAWNCFTNDYQQSEYQSGGLKKFKLHMEPKHNLDAAFSWNKDTFVKLKIKNLKADFYNPKQPPAILEAEYKNELWKFYFIYVQRDNKWKIDDIVGYRPAILDIQQQDSNSAKQATEEAEIEIQARFLMISPDANEITKFFEEENIKAALINDDSRTNIKNHILDDEQRQELLGLIRNNPKSKTLTSPKVTVLNGESATITIQKDVQYTETAENSGQPKEKELTIGTTFQVKPTLQNDGREILLDFEFEHISLLGFEDGLPQTEIANIKSRVSVPDGGTLLVGGQKITDDQNEQKILLCLIKAVQSESGS